MRSRAHNLLALSASLAFWLVFSLAGGSGSLARASDVDRSAIEHASHIFIGAADIVTATTADGTEYTVIVTDSLKGDLLPQTLVVARASGGQILAPGKHYLFLTRYDPEAIRYLIQDLFPPPTDAGLAEWRAVIAGSRCELDDVLRLDGVTYARRDWNDDKRYLEREWVGRSVARVDRQDTSATACRDDLEDGSASQIPAGTRIQELDGYTTSFRVAVRMPDRHRYLYEAVWSDRAEIGADLLDIAGRVTAIDAERWTGCVDGADCPADILRSDDPRLLEQVTAALLQAPVAAGGWNADQSARRLRLHIILDDESTVDLVIDLKTGRAQNGIRVPVDDLIGMLWPR